MLVFIEKRLVLLATPKAGSTALHMVLAPHADMVFRNMPQVKHMGLQRYMRFVVPMLAQFSDAPLETCALIREPVAWLGSWYRYRSRPELNGTPRSTRGMDFESFVQDYLRRPSPAHAAVGAQGRFLTGPKGGGVVDVLFRHEAMPAFVDWLSARLDLPIELPVVNRSPDGALDMSQETRARLHQERPRCFALHAAARG